MTALLKSQTTTVVSDPVEPHSLFHGDGVELFSSGSAPQMRNSWTGEGTAMFSSGSTPQASGGQSVGALVELFSSGSTPASAVGIEAGECVGLFSSGS